MDRSYLVTVREVEDSSPSPSPEPTPTPDPEPESGDAISLRHFGAEPQAYDAKTPTDQTAALQNAIDLAAARRQPLRIPPGTWWHKGLQIHHGLTMAGASETLSILKMIPGAEAHCLRPSALDVGNVVLSDFCVDGSELLWLTVVRDLDAHTWGDGINMHLSGTNTDYVRHPANIPQIPDPFWRLDRLRIVRVMRHGLHMRGRGEHQISNIRIGNPLVDGIRVNASDCIFMNVEAGGCGRNGMLVNGGNCRVTNAKMYFCGERTARGDGQSAAIRNAWTEWWAGSNQDTKFGGGHGFLIRDSGITSMLINVEAQDTWGSGIVLADAKDATIYGQSNNVKALRDKYNLGSAATKEASVLHIAGNTKGCRVTLSHKCQYNGSGYATDKVLTSSGNGPAGNRVDIIFDTAQPFAGGEVNLHESWLANGNTASVTGVAKS